MDLISERGYTLMEPPHIVKYEAMMGTGYFPGGEEMAYHLDERDASMYLIGTSEVPIAAYHLDEILQAADGVMVARGDLGVEVPIEQMAVLQKQIIARSSKR